MKKVMLTSAGFENPVISEKFLSFVGKSPEDIKVIFIPTAAIDEASKAVLPKCRNDLLFCGILDENIYTYNFESFISQDEFCAFDAIYFCGGNTRYLMKKINKQKNFRSMLKAFIKKGGVYVGVSAGSLIATRDLFSGLHYADCYLEVHQNTGNEKGEIALERRKRIKLTDSLALILEENKTYILE